MITLTLILVLLVCATTQQEKKDVDALIDQIFTKPAGNSSSGASAELSRRKTCNCVAYRFCSNSDGIGLVQPRVAEKEPCPNPDEICCDQEKITRRCGYHNPDGVDPAAFNVGNNQAKFGEFPWMVAVLRSARGNLDQYLCGGSLIHPQVVITAAHCVSKTGKTYKIRAGEWNNSHTEELYPHQHREVESVILHPSYYGGALYNDIALLFLKTPVDTAKNVDVVCLPPADVVVESGDCYATGWGKDIYGKKGIYQVILKKLKLPVISRQDCESELKKTQLGTLYQLHSSFMCTGGKPGKVTCKGDDGGPLVCPIRGIENRFYQTGIMSWNFLCGTTGAPGVYTNLPLFRNWIDGQMKAKNLDVSSYQY